MSVPGALFRAYVLATYNNTVVTLTDATGNVLAQSSAGRLGFKGPKKSTPYAASLISKQAVEKAKNFELQEVDVYVKGVGSGRESAVRGLFAAGLNVLTIRDVTPIPHNGCRRPRPRRV
jgi:small subunit ribosomal protein S11